MVGYMGLVNSFAGSIILHQFFSVHAHVNFTAKTRSSNEMMMASIRSVSLTESYTNFYFIIVPCILRTTRNLTHMTWNNGRHTKSICNDS